MPLTPKQPLREITPEERKRSMRTFLFILLGFPSLVGVMVAYVSLQGRPIRMYGREVLALAQQQTLNPTASYGADCTQYLKKPVPEGIKQCRVQAINGQLEVVMTTADDRSYHIRK